MKVHSKLNSGRFEDEAGGGGNGKHAWGGVYEDFTQTGSVMRDRGNGKPTQGV